jgi:molybdate transport system substrate-binding protein
LLGAVTPHLVYGENVAQTFQFFATGNARYALVARSQLYDEGGAGRHMNRDGIIGGCVEYIHLSSDNVLAQQAVLLVRAQESQAARHFLDVLRGSDARQLIERRGYRLPQADD